MRATGHGRKGRSGNRTIGTLVLPHDERALRRKLVTLDDGRDVLVDLPKTVMLGTGDLLILETGESIEINAANEPLYKITGRDELHLAQLCWHIGNRHLPCEIVEESGRPTHILINQDKVLADMLRGLGATLTEIVAPFSPLRGAYGDHGHGHHLAHS